MSVLVSVADSYATKPLPLKRFGLEARVGIALRNPLFRHKLACSSEESSRIRPYPFLIRSNHFGARFGAHRYTKFSQVLREKLWILGEFPEAAPAAQKSVLGPIVPDRHPQCFPLPDEHRWLFSRVPPSFQFECFRGTLCQGKHGISNKSLVRGFAL